MTSTASTEAHQGLLPAPAHRRAGDYLFVSSIHPLTADGVLARAHGPSPWAGESEMAAQTRAVLDALRDTLTAAGSSLDRTLKVEVQLADATDFAEFKRVYAEAFPDAAPARTTIVVGDEHIIDGARLNLHAVALAGDSPLAREVIHTDAVPDPRAAEHASLAVKAGPFVWTSGFAATDFQTGLAVARVEGFPHFGSPTEMQARYVLENLQHVLAAAGTDLTQGVKVQIYLDDLQSFFEVDRTWAEYVGVPPTRSTMACRGFLVPGALWLPNLLTLVPGEGFEKQETRAGIPWHPVDAGKANFSPGIRAGDWLFTAGQVPLDDIAKHEWAGAPAGLPHHWDDIEIQADHTLGLLRGQLDANGFSFADVVDARIYLVDPRRDFRGFVRSWERAFAGVAARPAMSLIPSRQASGLTGVLIEGPMIEIDFTCKQGA